jgi:outer membrane scaffolding protein for murein synthesis (MipA/OmpV family)
MRWEIADMTIRRHVAAAVAVLLPALAMAGEEKPLWEVGAGVAAFSFPAYRGSDNVHNFLLPVPYFTYHGEFLKADRHGLRGSLFDSDRVDLTLSLSASPPTKSDDVAVRAGMADLKPTAEFGPQVDVTLWRSDDRARFLKLRLPVRAAFSIERAPKDIGWVFSPNLNADITDLPGLPGWNLGLVAGPIYATRKQHDYFYSVAPEQASATRPAYAASGGYSGSQFLASLSRRFDKTWVGAFVRYDSLRSAAFIGSPLVARRNFAAAGIAVSWVIDESKTRVPVND